MRKLLLATAALAALGVGAAHADDNEARGFGAAAGGTTGAIAGAVVGGPIGAIVGGFAGAVLGAESAVPAQATEYVIANPVEPVYIEGEINEGYVVPETVMIQPIPDYPDYGYIYVEDRPVMVSLQTREVVYSPGYVLGGNTITYVENNPVDPVILDGGVSAGVVIPQEVQLYEVPESRYSYIYVDGQPVLVESDSRTVVWVR
jgi:hypothetical protein